MKTILSMRHLVAGLLLVWSGSAIADEAGPAAGLESLLQGMIRTLYPNVPEDWQSECQKFR